MKHIIAFWMAACLAAGFLYALDLRGRVVDADRQPIEFASIAAFAGGFHRRRLRDGFDGRILIVRILPGRQVAHLVCWV